MRILAALILLILASIVQAEDGLVVQFTINETDTATQANDRYINAILMELNGTTVSEIDSHYKLKFQVQYPGEAGDGIVDLVFTLTDLSTGKPYYVGAAPVSIKVGESEALEFDRNGRAYRVVLDTSYGKLPDHAKKP